MCADHLLKNGMSYKSRTSVKPLCPACGHADLAAGVYNAFPWNRPEDVRSQVRKRGAKGFHLLASWFPALYRHSLFFNARMLADFESGLLRCSECGFTWASEFFDSKKLKDFYATAYWRERWKTEGLSPMREPSPRAAGQYEFVKDYVNFNGNLLEVGAGKAEMMQLVRMKGKKAKVDVIEPGEDYTVFYQMLRFNRVARYFDGARECQYDYIHTSHWLEHQQNPERVIRALCRSLAEEGYLYIEVPNVSENYWKYYGAFFPHVCFFSEKSLLCLIEKSGLSMVKTGTFGVSWKDLAEGVREDAYAFQNKPNEDGINLRMLCKKNVKGQ